MPKYFGPAFNFKRDNNPHPSKAYVYDSLKHAKDCYAEFVADAEKFGFGEPADYNLYKGSPDHDEETHGYPEFADYMFSVNKRTGKISRYKAAA